MDVRNSPVQSHWVTVKPGLDYGVNCQSQESFLCSRLVVTLLLYGCETWILLILEEGDGSELFNLYHPKTVIYLPIFYLCAIPNRATHQ